MVFVRGGGGLPVTGTVELQMIWGGFLAQHEKLDYDVGKGTREWLYQISCKVQMHSDLRVYLSKILAPVPLTIFRSNSKFDQSLQCSGLKCTQPITTKFCIRHYSVTIKFDRNSFSGMGAWWGPDMEYIPTLLKFFCNVRGSFSLSPPCMWASKSMKQIFQHYLLRHCPLVVRIARTMLPTPCQLVTRFKHLTPFDHRTFKAISNPNGVILKSVSTPLFHI